MPKPDYDYVLKMRKGLAEQWNGAWQRWKRWEELFHQEHLIDYVKPAKVRKLGIARGKLLAMVDTLVTRDPQVRRRSVAEGDEHDRKADKVELWARALLRKAAADLFTLPPFRQAGMGLALLGYATGVVRWNEDAWPRKPKRGRGSETSYEERLEFYERSKKRMFPFVIEFPHPSRILIPHTDREPSLAIETLTMARWQVDQMLGKTGRSENPFEAIQIINFWESGYEDWRGMWAGSEEIEVVKNELNFIPITHAFSGFGSERAVTDMNYTQGQGSSPGLGMRPQDQAIGLFFGIEDSIIFLDEFNTAMRSLAMRAAYPVMLTEEDAAEFAEQIAQAGQGGVVQVEKILTTKWEEVPNVARTLLQVPNTAMQDIDLGTFAGVVQGQRVPGTQTATQHAMMLGAARQRFDVPMTQLNYMAGQILSFCARLVAERDEPVTIDGITCGKEDFEGFYDFEVDFMAKDEAGLLRGKEQAMVEFEKGLLDFEGYQRVAGREDATRLWRRIIRDRALLTEQVQGPIIQAAVADFQQKVEAEGGTAVPAPPSTGREPTGISTRPETSGATRIPGDQISEVPAV